MKKAFLSVLAVFIVSAVSCIMLSCSKDDDEGGQQPKKDETSVKVTFYTAATDSQLLFINQNYKFSVNGSETTVKIGDMTVADTATAPCKQNLIKGIGMSKPVKSFKLYKKEFSVPKGQVVTFVNYDYSAKGNHPNDSLLDVMMFYYLQGNDISEFTYHKDVYVSELQSFLGYIQKKNKNVSVTAK